MEGTAPAPASWLEPKLSWTAAELPLEVHAEGTRDLAIRLDGHEAKKAAPLSTDRDEKDQPDHGSQDHERECVVDKVLGKVVDVSLQCERLGDRQRTRR